MATQVTLNSGSVDSAGSLALKSNGATTAVTIDTSQNVGIGTASPTNKLHVSSSSFETVKLQGTGTVSGINFVNSASSNGFIYYDNSPNMLFYTNGSERMRIDSSGNLLVGTTSVINGSNAIGQFLNVNGGRPAIAVGNTAGSSATNTLIFINSNGTVGSIQTSASSTSYVTFSDYRLKNTIAPMTGALAKVGLLKPCTYKWNADGSDGQGFIAHELDAVVAGCVTGEKDAVDADGKPQYQGIDTSFLVATLTAAIQEQQALITALTARITALESK